MEYLHLASDLLPWGIAVIVGLLGLRLKPLEDRITRLEKTMEQHYSQCLLQNSNYDRWRGQVTVLLEANSEDHRELKDDIKSIVHKLDAKS